LIYLTLPSAREGKVRERMSLLVRFVGYQAVAMVIVGSLLATLAGLALCTLKRSRRVGVRIAIISAAIFICMVGLAALEGSPELHAYLSRI
jgi:hypothetical protein